MRTVLTQSDGHHLHFNVEASDEIEKANEVTHARFIIDINRFSHRASEKHRTTDHRVCCLGGHAGSAQKARSPFT